MLNKLFLFLLLFFSSHCFVYSLKCYISSIPILFNYTLTSTNLPLFDKLKLSEVSGECTLTIIWLRNPLNSEIIFGYNSISNRNNLEIDSLLLANIQYQIDGEELTKRLSHDIQYKCQSSDGCNNETIVKRILNSLRLEEHFSDHFNSLILSNPLFNNQSINKCYFQQNTTINPCSSIDFFNCQRCQISMNFFRSSTTEICATCPTITSNYNSITRDAIFILNNRSQILDRVQLLCQIGEHCNSIENVQQIRQATSIDFDFEKYFSSSSSSSHLSFLVILQIIFHLIRLSFLIE